MEKKAFLTLEQAKNIAEKWPTPWHIYDEKGIRENAEKVRRAFAWNKGFREYFAVKATPNPFILKILKEYGCGTDCSSDTELMMSEACGFSGHDSLKIGVGMMTRGEVALIVAQKGLAEGFITSVYFTSVILLIIVSSICTPIILKFLYSKDPAPEVKYSVVRRKGENHG